MLIAPGRFLQSVNRLLIVFRPAGRHLSARWLGRNLVCVHPAAGR